MAIRDEVFDPFEVAIAQPLTAAAPFSIELPLGFDCSFHNGIVDFVGARADGAIFCFIRWGQRDVWPDPYTVQNWGPALAAGMIRGGYWVWDERGGADADAHFDGVIEQALALGSLTYDGELPMVVDLELEPVDYAELRKFLEKLEDWMGRKPYIYTGSWFYNRIAPLPDWLALYEHWLTGYNETGPSIWGPTAALDPFVAVWQQANNWNVEWTEKSPAVDRNYWWAGEEHLREAAAMSKKAVLVDDLMELIQTKAIDVDPVPGPPTIFRLNWPTNLAKVVTQWFGVNAHLYAPFGLKGHEGLDIRAPNGSEILAAKSGTVYRIETDEAAGGNYGIQVRIQSDAPTAGGPFKTTYAHLQQVLVQEGDQVQNGDLIGLADNTGNSSGAHLHITLKKENDGSDWLQAGDIVNPVPYFHDIFPGNFWRIDVGGNYRSTPSVDTPNNLIRFVRPGEIVHPTGLFTGDWWELEIGGKVGWFWNPGYKVFPTEEILGA